MMTNSGGHFFEFGPFRIDVDNRLLSRDGRPLPITPKAVETLVALVQHDGQLLKKDDLIRIVWPEHVVEESNLTQNIYLLRKTLSEGSNGHNYIETVPRRGYRFVGDVREFVASGTDLILAETTSIQPISESRENAASVVALSDERSFKGPLSSPSRLLAPRVNRLWWVSTPILLSAAIITVAVGGYLALFRTNKAVETKAPSLRASDNGASAADKFSEQHLTANPNAYNAYVQGRSYWAKETTPALEQAIQQFQEALRHDPNYPLPYAGLAEAYASLASHYDATELNPSDIMSKAKIAAARAVELNDSLAEAHTALGVIKERYDWDWQGAEQNFKRAIELDPNNAHAHQVYSLFLMATGRTAEAEAEAKRAQELDPASLSIGKNLGDFYYLTRDYDQALEQYRRTLKLDPTDPVAASIHRAMAWAYELHGMHEQAIAEFIETARVQNAGPERLSIFRRGYDSGGMKGYWRAWLELQRERINRGSINPFYLAQVYAFVGERDRAFSCLAKACEDRSLDTPALRASPTFDDLRKDARYVALLQRIGLKS